MSWLCEGYADETDNDYYFAYLLRDNAYFYNTVYQIVRRNAENCYVKTYKVNMNGAIKIVYDTDGLTSFKKFAQGASAPNMMSVLEKMVKILNVIRTDSFTQIETIDVREHRIFVDENLDVRLVCIPVSVLAGRETYLQFEQDVRRLITGILYQSDCINDKYVERLFHDLTDSEMSLEDLQTAFDGKRYGIRQIEKNTNVEKAAGRESIFGYFILSAVNRSKDLDIIVNSTEFIVGKGTDGVNFTVRSSTAVSRIHCKFVVAQDGLYVVDMGSTNGTYVNGEQAVPDCYTRINIGDIIDIADCQYRVVSNS